MWLWSQNSCLEITNKQELLTYSRSKIKVLNFAACPSHSLLQISKTSKICWETWRVQFQLNLLSDPTPSINLPSFYKGINSLDGKFWKFAGTFLTTWIGLQSFFPFLRIQPIQRTRWKAFQKNHALMVFICKGKEPRRKIMYVKTNIIMTKNILTSMVKKKQKYH